MSWRDDDLKLYREHLEGLVAVEARLVNSGFMLPHESLTEHNMAFVTGRIARLTVCLERPAL